MPETTIEFTERVFDFRKLTGPNGEPLRHGIHMYRRRYKVGEKFVGDWIFASRNEDPDAPLEANAVVVVARVGDKVLIGDEFRVPLWTDPKNVSGPLPDGRSDGARELGLSAAGLYEPGDDVISRGVCELRQETGLFASRVYPGLTSGLLISSAGAMDEAVRIVFMDAFGDLDASLAEASENIRASLLSFNEVMDILWNSKQPLSAKAWGLFYGWWLRGKIDFFPEFAAAERSRFVPVVWESANTDEEAFRLVGSDAMYRTRV